MSYYVIIRGPAGVGKTTIARQLTKELKATYISFDQIREKHGIDLSEKGRIQANNKAIPEARKSMVKGKPVVFDGVFYHKSQVEHLTKALQYKHVVFSLKASLQECLERHRKRKSEISEKSVRDVYKLVAAFDCGIVIKTSEKSVKKCVNEIAFHIQ